MKTTVLREISTIIAATALALGVLATPAEASTSASCVPVIGNQLPVILVHGFSEGPSAWGSSDDEKSMLHAINTIPNVHAETFDYQSTNQRWVDDPNTGQRLAEQITCLAASSRQAGGPGKVGLVGHSMGGLAIQYAASQIVHGHKVADDIGPVATIGTPGTGSGLGDIGGSVRSVVCPAITTYKASILQFICGGDAVEALQRSSQQIDTLPPFPPNIPIEAIAGDVTINYPLFQFTLKDDQNGDLIVSKPSALKHANKVQSVGGQKVVACDTTIEALDTITLGPVAGPIANSLRPHEPLLPDCWHNALTNNPQVEQTVVATIKAYQAQLQAQADTARANQALAPFAHAWTVHNGHLEINANRTGTQTIDLGCGVAALGNCNEVDQLALIGPQNNTLTAKVTKVTAPAGQQPSLKVGDTFKLMLEHDGHVLQTVWSDRQQQGNPYWCDKYASDSSFRECGQ